jgi:hypothetical protein
MPPKSARASSEKQLEALLELSRPCERGRGEGVGVNGGEVKERGAGEQGTAGNATKLGAEKSFESLELGRPCERGGGVGSVEA